MAANNEPTYATEQLRSALARRGAQATIRDAHPSAIVREQLAAVLEGDLPVDAQSAQLIAKACGRTVADMLGESTAAALRRAASAAGDLTAETPAHVLVAGDWHGNSRWALSILNRARAAGVTHILHVGDFGFWTGRDGAHYLDELDAQLQLNGQRLWFVDGNHEAHPDLLLLPVDPATGVRPLTPRARIFHLPRGFRWQWAGKTWMSLGGASSVDKAFRVAGVSWWPEELITDAQAQHAARGGPVDVMLTHDCPAGVHIPGLTGGWPEHALWIANEHRNLLGGVVDAVKPELLIHGHFHTRYDARRDHPRAARPARIVGLDCDGSSLALNTVLVDTTTLAVTQVPEVDSRPGQL